MRNPSLFYTIALPPAMDGCPSAPYNLQDRVRTCTLVVLAGNIEERCLATVNLYCMTNPVKEKASVSIKNEPDQNRMREPEQEGNPPVSGNGNTSGNKQFMRAVECCWNRHMCREDIQGTLSIRADQEPKLKEKLQ